MKKLFLKDNNEEYIFNILMGCTFLVIIWSFLASSGPIQWMDNGRFLSNASTKGYFLDYLSAIDHPLQQTVNKLLYELGNQTLVSLLNSFLLIPLSYLIYRLSLLLGTKKVTAISIVLTTILSHVVFWVSTKVEVYMLSSVLITYIFYYIIKNINGLTFTKFLFIGFIFGLSITIHQLSLIACFPILIYIVYLNRSSILFLVLGCIIGSFSAWKGIYIEYLNGMDILTAIRFFLTGSSPATAGWESALFRFDLVFQNIIYVLPIALSFIGYQLLGIIPTQKKPIPIVMWISAISVLLFSISYNVPDRFTFNMQAVIFFSILGGIYCENKMNTLVYINFLFSPVVLLTLYYSGISLPTSDELPYRDNLKYFLVPYLKEDSALQFANYLDKNYENVTIYADSTSYTALQSAKTYGLLNNLEIDLCSNFTEASRNNIFLIVRKNSCENIRYNGQYLVDITN